MGWPYTSGINERSAYYMSRASDPALLVRTLMQAGHHAPSADNSQPWRFYWDGERLSVKYDGQRVSGRTFGPEEHATLLAMGAVKENIVQMAHFLDADLEPLKVEIPNDSQAYFQFTLKSSPKQTKQTREHSLFQRHTNRFPYDSKPIPSEIVESLNGMSQGQCHALIFADREMIKKIARWVRIASEVRFQSRDIHEFLGQSLRFTPEEATEGDGLDVRTLPLPPGGRTFLRFIKDWHRLAFLNRFGLYKILALTEAKPISQAQTLLAIAGPDNSSDALDAGILMERIWINLNSHGIAVHPYYVVTDQLQRLKAGKIPTKLNPGIQAVESESATILNSKNDSIHMLFRIGYPKKQPIRSLRLPSEKIIEFIQP